MLDGARALGGAKTARWACRALLMSKHGDGAGPRGRRLLYYRVSIHMKGIWGILVPMNREYYVGSLL